MRKHLVEGTTEFVTDSEEKISREMEVFYNPVMKLNRDTTIAMVLAMDRKPGTLRIGLPLEASGLRAARILHELVRPGFISPRAIRINDISPEAIAYAKENIALNSEGVDPKETEKVSFSTTDASIMLRHEHFDYIDIDPFGTPNPFLDAAVHAIERGGVLAVTATDTAALAGTYPAATARKYWSVPSRTWLMHDAGLRILIRKVQLVGAQYEKGLVPILSLSTEHYYRIFFRCERSNARSREILVDHKFLHVCERCLQTAVSEANTGVCMICGNSVSVAGPLWIGPLHDRLTATRMRERILMLDRDAMKELDALLAIIEEECKVDSVGFYDVHELASRYKAPVPKREVLLERLGERACRTHINGHGIKTTLSVPVLVEALRGLAATDRE